MGSISERKLEHLDVCVHEDVGFRSKSPLFECVTLQHNALPELELSSIDLSCPMWGKKLRAPFVIAAMTGGNEHAGKVNRELASIAEERGYAFGLGSQRPALTHPESLRSFQVREVAPTTVVLGNIGVVQASQMTCRALQELADSVGADALCVHLNPAMELIQTEGDRDFRGNLNKLAELNKSLSIPVVAKETGCGISLGVARRLVQHGILNVDVSGAGGTSWVAVEYHRTSEARRELAKTFWDWGIPTAASVAMCVSQGMQTVFATGGVTSGLDAARAIALGASAAGIARPLLRTLATEGRAGADAFMERMETELRMAMLLVGAANLDALRRSPKMIMDPLRTWLQLGSAS